MNKQRKRLQNFKKIRNGDIREFLSSPIQNQTPESGVALATPTFSQASTSTSTPVISDSELTEHDLGFKIAGPAQPRLSSYSKSKFGSEKHLFQAAYFSFFGIFFLFLILNIVYKKIRFFSFRCRHFPTPIADTAFTKVGVKNWKKIKEKLQQHAKCRSHIDSQRSWIEFQSTSSAGSAAIRSYVKVIVKKLQPTGLMQNKSLIFFSTTENKDFPFEDTMKPRAPQIVETFWNYVIGMENELSILPAVQFTT